MAGYIARSHELYRGISVFDYKDVSAGAANMAHRMRVKPDTIRHQFYDSGLVKRLETQPCFKNIQIAVGGGFVVPLVLTGLGKIYLVFELVDKTCGSWLRAEYRRVFC